MLFKKQNITVEQIHAEFDAAEEKAIQSYKKLMDELNIPTESQLERKAELLEELGFNKSETVEQANMLKKERRKNVSLYTDADNIVSTIGQLKVHYPLEKFIPIDVFESICEKYGLIHAPVSNYIKDVPEKNVLEIKNRKPLLKEHKIEKEYSIKNYHKDFLLFNYLNVPGPIIKESDLKCAKYTNLDCLEDWLKKGDTTFSYAIVRYGTTFLEGKGSGVYYEQYDFKNISIVRKDGLFIAAPKTHFDLTNLEKKSKFGFFKFEEKEVKDPIVFEYCKNNIVRIISKWGTDDDKSYLDPELNSDFN
jgi:hypothetical protein